ncbi:MAG: hypothetical protein RL173_884 [Fibrobacterota bacterium]|jgi:HD-like signal output (HDOD) protein/CheY-like chemotaxis protein
MKATDAMILVVDDDPDFRESIGDLLGENGYEYLLAGSSPQALEFASRQKISMCLLDVSMPGVDGIQLLRYFRSRHVFRLLPVIVITAGVRMEAVQNLLKLGVRDVMLKSKFPVNELLEMIAKRLNPNAEPPSRSQVAVVQPSGAPESESGLPPPSGFDSDLPGLGSIRNQTPDSKREHGGLDAHPLSSDLIASLGSMRAFSGITDALISAASRPGVSLSDLELIVKRDPVIAARMVQTANSAAFVRGAPVTKVEEALRVLGFTNVIHIATSGAILRQEDLVSEVGDDLVSIWKNCLATGMISEMLAEKADKPSAFLRGLLHNLPSFFALQFLGSDWLPWRAHAIVKGWPLREAITSALGCPLENVSGQILESYRIPADVANPILEFHEFYLASKPREPGRAARMLDVARHLASGMGRPSTILSDIRTIHQDEVKELDIASVLNPKTIEDVAILEQSCNVSSHSSVLPKLNREVALWRDARWVSPDPVESLLGCTTDCVRVERLEELSDWNRVRIAIAEPGSLEWERLGKVAPVLVLHRASLRAEPLPAGVETLRMPIPIHHLLHRISIQPPGF